MSEPAAGASFAPKKSIHPFRRAILRGLGIVLPPLLTVVVFIWAWTLIERYVLVPVESTARTAIVMSLPPAFDKVPPKEQIKNIVRTDSRVTEFTHNGTDYTILPRSRQWVPKFVLERVEENPDALHEPNPVTAGQYYAEYANVRFLPRAYVIPVFLLVFVLLLYCAGKFFARGIGSWIKNLFDGLIHRLPIVRNVYSSVKQITDFVFSEQELEYTRVVAVEYPRKGIWSLGFVTGESMLDIRNAVGEPVLSILMPTSPMPATGFTISVAKSETIDLDLTVDQAVQFIVSCGVVVPPHQQPRIKVAETALSDQIARKAAEGAKAENSTAPAGE